MKQTKVINGCPDETYFYIKGRDGADPCDQYESCEECPYYKPEEDDE